MSRACDLLKIRKPTSLVFALRLRARRRKMTSSSSSSDPCPICLEPVKQEAYLDRCFHAYCYHCITRWTRVVTNKHSQSLSSIKCPLCKTDNFSIVHSFNGDSFQRHYINQDPEKSFLSSAHNFRWQCYNIEAGSTHNIFNAQRFWKRHMYLQRNIWLESWLRREIQTLIQEEDVDIIVHHIYGVIESFLRRQKREGIQGSPERKREEFKTMLSDASRPFILGQTERFINELELFLVSGLNIEAYDKVCMQYLGVSPANETREHGEEICDRPLQDRFLHFLDEDLDRTD